MASAASGGAAVPDAPAPVHVPLGQDHAVGVEPDVRVRHVVPGSV